ncbi:hypothetical protein MaudCBS49596_001570 [Microsporum audouinii]
MEIPKLPLAGPGYLILNIIRAMNIISLLAIIAANTILLIKTVLVSNFFFFETVTHVAIASISSFLIVSELSVFRSYFNRNWPLLGEDSGFVTLGTAMVLLGISTLGDLNNEATRQGAIGLPFWRLILGAGIISIVIGAANIGLSYVFRDSDLGVSARHVRARGAVATQEAVTRKDSYRSFQLSRKGSLPTYSSSTSSPRSVSLRQPSRFPVRISSPIVNNPEASTGSPITPKSPMPSEIAAPNLAHHPAIIKALSIFFAPILIPKAIALFRSVHSHITNRPPLQALPPLASRALNILFFSTALFLALSLPSGSNILSNNSFGTNDIFKLTSSRFNTPTELLFSRLRRLGGRYEVESEHDLTLKKLFSSPTARALYLQLGPEPLIACPFCSLDSSITYLFYYLPFNTLVPHLFHFLVIGIVTSSSIVGPKVARWRNKFLIGSVALLMIELCVILRATSPLFSLSTNTPSGQRNKWTQIYSHYPDAPASLHVRLITLRPLAFTLFDVICAALIYLSATNRLFYTTTTRAEQAQQLVSISATAMLNSVSRLQAVSVVRNTIARDLELSAVYDAYFQKKRNDEWVWREEEVVEAVAKVMNDKALQTGNRKSENGSVIIDADDYVEKITAGLEGQQSVFA